jgi:serine/threonine protein kinase
VFEHGVADARSDVYAVGCVLYQALTGQVPFPAELTAAKVFAHLSTDPPSLLLADPTLPVSLDAVIAKAMAKDPGARYQRAGDLGRAATDALSEIGTEETQPLSRPLAPVRSPAPAPPAPPRPAERARRRPWLVPAGIVLASVVVVALIVATRPGSPGRRATGGGPVAASGSNAASATSALPELLVEQGPPSQAYRVRVPRSWQFQDLTEPSDHTTHVWWDPVDSNRRIKIALSACVGCVTDDSGKRDPAKVLPLDVTDFSRIGTDKVAYRTTSMNNPYPVNGIVVLLAKGGYAQVDLWLPEAEHDRATAILNSFTPTV